MSDGDDDGDDDNGDYEVGYGRPPKHTRWPPGVSGNPRGREKGHKGLKTDLEAELNTVSTVAGKDGWKQKGRQQRLAVATLCRRAANGDLKAQALLFPMIATILGVEDRRNGPRQLSAQDQALLDAILASQSDEDGNGPGVEEADDLCRLSPPIHTPTDQGDQQEEAGDDQAN